MKKLIYSLSVAVAFGVAANAANPVMQMQKASSLSTDVKAVQVAPVSMEFERISPAKHQAKRGAVTTADFEGTYKWSGRNQLQQVVFPNEGVMTIQAVAGDPTKMLIMGFDGGADPGLDAYLDPSTGRLYVPNQFTFLNTYYNQDVWFVNWTVYNGEMEDGSPAYGLMQAPDDKQFFFTLTENGIQAGDVDADKWDNHTYTDAELADVCCIACNLMPENEGGYFWMCFGVRGEELKDFEFVADQWQYLGEADFTDAWFNLFWENNIAPTYEVPLYYDKTQPGRYMLYNPYGCGTVDTNPFLAYDLNIGKEPGYLIFDITDPECVVFEPLIYSITIDMREDSNDPVLPQPLYCYNLEGSNYYLFGATTEDIIIYFEQNDLECSWLNTRTNEVNIYNAVFSMGLSADYYTWTNIPMDGSIVLTGNYMDGVESVLGEDINAPVQYYNLQGVRVANPEKGQLVIVRKGNKAMKQIVR